jgi:ethanolamine utilization protein EutN
MRLARVVGNLVATVKDSALAGKKILILKHVNEQGEASGRAFIALDSIGAGAGEMVYYVKGKEASFPFLPDEVPSDATIVGIVDSWDGMKVQL